MEVTRHNLHAALGAPLLRSWKTFWNWWIGELSAMLPEDVRRALRPSEQQLILTVDGAYLLVDRRSGDSITPVGRYTLGPNASPPPELSAQTGMTAEGIEVVLCLPTDKVLTRTLKLPLATEENLREVLAFQMDRQTPFTLEQVYYDYAVVARDRKTRTLSLDFVVAPRAVVDGLIDSLERLDIHPGQVTLCPAGRGEPMPVNLLPVPRRPRKRMAAQRINIGLGVLAVLLLVGAVSLPLLHKARVVRTLQPMLDVAASKAQVAQKLREKVDALKAESQFLVEKKQQSLLVLEVMDELTRILPDHTWLTRLEISPTEVQVQGQSTSSGALIPLTESSPLLHNARFRSPVTQIPRTNEERFHLSAETRREAAP